MLELFGDFPTMNKHNKNAKMMITQWVVKWFFSYFFDTFRYKFICFYVAKCNKNLRCYYFLSSCTVSELQWGSFRGISSGEISNKQHGWMVIVFAAWLCCKIFVNRFIGFHTSRLNALRWVKTLDLWMFV